MLGRSGPHPLQAFNRVLQVNLVGTFNAIRLAADAMDAYRRGIAAAEAKGDKQAAKEMTVFLRRLEKSPPA